MRLDPREERAEDLLESQIEAIHRFPDQNPNPVLRMTDAGRLVYANVSSRPITDALGARVGDVVPEPLLGELRVAAADPSSPSVEIVAGVRTFAILPVAVPELGFVNLYGTDVTAAKVVDRFPGRNPNPVFRIDDDGRLVYANDASMALVAGLGWRVGEAVDPARLAEIRGCVDRPGQTVEVATDGRIFELTPASVREFGFINVYATDVTAARAVDKFPDQNPNPVLRVSPDGVLIYSNPAAAPLVRAFGVTIGQALPEAIRGDILRAAAGDAPDTLEVETDTGLFSILVRSVYEFGFVNLYGTDITARRAVERANRENEWLLLNILPAPIAERLRTGERVIADRFDEVTLLFADIVDFTVLSSRLAPGAVVELLNDVFSLFDTLVDRHGLEKIKTIGDAYMVVGGLPEPGADDVARVADMALELGPEVARLPVCQTYGIRFRIGMHTGPAVAGVIGARKFIYDVWGDTVNTASRMESHGIPGRIQVTDAVRDRLRDSYRFEPRGVVDVRGKGPMQTWFLVGRS